MIALKTNTRFPKKAGSRPALEIRFHFVDGSKETFIQANAETANVILHRIDPFERKVQHPLSRGRSRGAQFPELHRLHGLSGATKQIQN